MNDYKIILGIETSCDETAAAVLKKDGEAITVLSSVISSSAEIQAKFGGIIPEQAAREQVKAMIPVLKEALHQAFPSDSLEDQIKQIDAIAVTYGPGLIGSLLVGVETAKTLAMAWNKPLLPINHLIGHYYANWVEGSHLPSTGKIQPNPRSADNLKYNLPRETKSAIPTFPCIGLLVSGGHTDLVLFQSHNNYKYLGGTRDDAAGECFDKCARLLGYPYPGGPKISQLAKEGDPKKFVLPLPMADSHDYDFSFSGLKTAFLNLTKTKNIDPASQEAKDLCATLENTIVKSLVRKTIKAVQEYRVNTIIVGGGVSANQKLRENLKFEIGNLKSFDTAQDTSDGELVEPLDIALHFPDLKYCGDNAAMIAAAAFFTEPEENAITIQANPNLSL